MSKHGKITIETPSCGDREVDAIALCIQAILTVRDAAARCRIVDYLQDRFDVEITIAAAPDTERVLKLRNGSD